MNSTQTGQEPGSPAGSGDSGGPIITITADDERYDRCRTVAMDLARAEHAALLLYDWDAGRLLSDPLPTQWSADHDDHQEGMGLDADALRTAGRESIACQVEEAQALGIEAAGWLPSTPGLGALAGFAHQRGAGAVVMPAHLEGAGMLEKLFERHNDPAHARQVLAPIRVVAVDDAPPA